MPNERSGIYPGKKQIWREIYINNLLTVFSNKDVSDKALIDREGIHGFSGKPDSIELKAALKAIDELDTSKYTGDLARAKGMLLGAGFTAIEIDTMPKSFQLIADAAIFYAKSRNLLTLEDKNGKLGFGPIDLTYNEELQGDNAVLFMEDKKRFTNIELSQLCKPLILFQFSRHCIIKTLEDVDFQGEEREIFTRLLVDLNEIYDEILAKETINETINESDFEEMNKKFQASLSKTHAQLKKISGDKYEENSYYSLIFSAIKPRQGLELLRDTFTNNTSNTQALGRMLLAIDNGSLTVNGQKPDSTYPLGEYLIHGGRVKFDVSALSDEEQEEFFEFITANQAQKRGFATHSTGGFDASGSPAELKSGLWGALKDVVRSLFGQSKHYGINIAVGGNSIPNREGILVNRGQLPQENGEWGHIYIHKAKNNNLILMGMESCAPYKTNARTGEKHSMVGKSDKSSAFLKPKINSMELYQQQLNANKTPLSTFEKNNWASVAVSSEQFSTMKQNAEKYETDSNPKSYATLIHKIPEDAAAPQKDRLQKMRDWAKETKQRNKDVHAHAYRCRAAQLFGGLIALAGIILIAVPIPGVAQAMGGSLVALGVGVATTTVGAGLFATASYKAFNPGDSINKGPFGTKEEVQIPNNSPSSLVRGLSVEKPTTTPSAAVTPAPVVAEEGPKTPKPKNTKVKVTANFPLDDQSLTPF